MKEITTIRSTVCKKAAAYIKSGMNRGSRFPESLG